MQVKILRNLAGSGQFLEAGLVTDLPEEKARQLLKAGDAEPVAKKPETATAKSPEKRG